MLEGGNKTPSYCVRVCCACYIMLARVYVCMCVCNMQMCVDIRYMQLALPPTQALTSGAVAMALISLIF